MADIVLATLILLAGVFTLFVTLMAGASAPIPGQGPSLRGPFIVGSVLTVLGVLWWTHILW